MNLVCQGEGTVGLNEELGTPSASCIRTGKETVGVNTFDEGMRREAEIVLAAGKLPVGCEIARNGQIVACG